MAASGTDRFGEGHLYLLTLTAPGSRQHRMPSGEFCPCTPPGGIDLPAWNASHSRRWNHFRTLLRREYPMVEFFRAIEVQQRGALHDHPLLRAAHGGRPISLHKVRALALRAGFGHSVDLKPLAPGSRAAAHYVSKYVTKATDSRAEVPWSADVVDLTTGEVTRAEVPGRYRTWSMSREWGDSMRDVRARAREYAALCVARSEAAATGAAVVVLADVLGALTVVDDDPSPPI